MSDVTTSASVATIGAPTLHHLPRGAAISDTLVIVQRNLKRLVRTPQLLFFATVQPVMFVLLFNYVFGKALVVPGRSYVDFLLPGIFVQTVAFGGINTAVGLSSDLSSGIVN
ncbi:MAG: ABC transporter permease, partial [Acidimicrobiia bacterium]